MASEPLPIACSLTNADLAARSELMRRELFSAAEEQQELDDGYAFRFLSDDRWKAKIEAFITTERQCCSFFRIDLTYEPALGPIWLKLTGPEGTKEFIEITFDIPGDPS